MSCFVGIPQRLWTPAAPEVVRTTDGSTAPTAPVTYCARDILLSSG